VIKFIAEGDSGERVLGIGLSHANIKEMGIDKPIVIKLDDLGPAGENIRQVLLFTGPTEEQMHAKLASLGLIPPDAPDHWVRDS